MYESFFRLSSRPFLAAPCAESYVGLGAVEDARETLTRSIDRGEGPGVIIGPPGTGKSLLCQVLAQQFAGRFEIAYLFGGRLATRRALLQNILYELKLPFRGLDESELRLSLIDHLEPDSGTAEGLLLIVDEAHALPLRLLEEVRVLTNIVCSGKSRVRLVLSGIMTLEERLSSPKLESFQQRLAARCYLQPLTGEQTFHYVQQQITRCGGAADRMFSAEAQTAIHAATGGVPRLINQLCDHALILAALGGHRKLDAAGIEEAWADLLQLPLPISGGSGSRTPSNDGSGAIEFGQLDEDTPKEEGARASVEAAAIANVDAISRSIDALQVEVASTGRRADDEEFLPTSATGTEVELIFHGAHNPFGDKWDDEEVVVDHYASLEDAALRQQRSSREPLAVAVTTAPSKNLDLATGYQEQASPPRQPISEQESQPRVEPASGPARRSNYRQLFSTLRRK